MKKYYELLNRIEKSNLSDEQKAILTDKLDTKVADIMATIAMQELEQK